MLTAACAASVLIWFWLFLGRSRFWRASERLPGLAEEGDRHAWPAVATITPARNEAETIGATMAAVLASDYRGPLSVTVVDDGSRDGTAALARQAGQGSTRPLTVVEGAPLPRGWTGKLWALEQGVRNAAAASEPPGYFLFVDADIELAPDTLSRLVTLAEKRGLALASLMARLDSRGIWGRLLVPAFVFFFQKLYPFPASNRPESDVAAAAGGCVLIRREVLEALGGLSALRGALIDDCVLADLVKRGPATEEQRRPIWLGLADREAVSLRDNRSLASLWAMVTRTAFVQLRRSWFLLGGCIAAMALTYLAGPAALLSLPWHNNWPAGILGGFAWALMAIAYSPTVRLYGGGVARSLTLPLVALIYTAMTVDSARRDLLGRGGAWKGRTYLGG